jgi:hypothetical protein
MKSSYAILVYGSDSDVRAAHGALTPEQLDGETIVYMMPPVFGVGSSRPLVLLGVGREGCEAVARRCAAGLDGVVAVVLVGPSTPWAERVPAMVGGMPPIGGGGQPRDETWTPRYEDRRPLGPLDPLRAVAERARLDCSNPCPDANHCEVCGGHPRDPLRLIITAHPEAELCAACDGDGILFVDAPLRKDRTFKDCPVCTTTGRALGSAEIARELVTFTYRETGVWLGEGGVSIIEYDTRAAHDSHALAAALGLAVV